MRSLPEQGLISPFTGPYGVFIIKYGIFKEILLMHIIFSEKVRFQNIYIMNLWNILIMYT